MSTNSKGYYRAGVWPGARTRRKKRGKRKEVAVVAVVAVARRGELDNRTSVPRRVPGCPCFLAPVARMYIGTESGSWNKTAHPR